MAFDVELVAHLSLAQQLTYLACFLRGAWLAERQQQQWRLLLEASGVTCTTNMLTLIGMCSSPFASIATSAAINSPNLLPFHTMHSPDTTDAMRAGMLFFSGFATLPRISSHSHVVFGMGCLPDRQCRLHARHLRCPRRQGGCSAVCTDAKFDFKLTPCDITNNVCNARDAPD